MLTSYFVGGVQSFLPVSIELKSISAFLWWHIIFHPATNLSGFSLFYPYFHRKCSDEMHSLIAPVLTFTATAHHATHIVRNHPHTLRISLITCMFHSSSFFLQTNALCNQLSKNVFSDRYTLKLLMSCVNHYPPPPNLINCASSSVPLYLVSVLLIVHGEPHYKLNKSSYIINLKGCWWKTDSGTLELARLRAWKWQML